MLGWMGMKYVQSELPRVNHENLLHKFKEGVFILDEDTAHLQFINKAAFNILQGLSQRCNLRLLLQTSNKNASSNVQVDLDQGTFKSIDVKRLR